MPLVILPMVVLMIVGGRLPLGLSILLHLGAFTMAALVCHQRLSADRPESIHLTEFYFWIAFGGMLGGVFNTLAAPLLFSRIIEYPLVLVLALAARRGGPAHAGSSWSMPGFAVPLGTGALTAGLFLQEFVPESTPWAHLDIAGPFIREKEWKYYEAGATAFGLKTLVDVAERFSVSQSPN